MDGYQVKQEKTFSSNFFDKKLQIDNRNTNLEILICPLFLAS